MASTKTPGKGTAEKLRGRVLLAGTERGIRSLAVEVVDPSGAPVGAFGRAVTDAEGAFELLYVGKDAARFLRGRPVLHLRVGTEGGETLCVTPEPVQNLVGGRVVPAIELAAAALPAGFVVASVSPLKAGLGVPVRFVAVHRPSGRALVSIEGVPDARLVEMAEDGAVPGLSTGEYAVQPGDRAYGAKVQVMIVEHGGEWRTFRADDLVSIDGVPPVLCEVKVEPGVVRNGQALRLWATTKPGSTVRADLAGLDTESRPVVLREGRGRTGTYSGRAVISMENRHGNGTGRIVFEAIDAVGNRGAPCVAAVELRNPQFDRIGGLPAAHAALLEGEGLSTLADLRAYDARAIAGRTGIALDVLRRTQALARFVTLDIPLAVAAELYDTAGLRSPSALAFVKPDDLGHALADAVANGRLHLDADPDAHAGNLVKKGKDLFGALAGAYVRDRVNAAGRCEGYCAPEDSSLGCLAYLLDLLQAAGFSTSGQLRLQFGWDVSAASTAPLRRIALCISILEPTVQVNPQHTSQRLYDQALNRVVIGLTGRSAQELATDAAYAAAMAAPNLYQQNALLEQALRAANLGAKVDAVLQALEPQYLQALLDQSGKTPEELLERYGLSFSTRECQEDTSCQQAILVLQRYLMEQADKDGATGAKPLLNYDTWRHEKVKQYYPENIYAVLFKQALIGGERDLFKSHLAKAKSILSTVRLTDGQTPSPEDTGALLTSFRNRSPYYQNLKVGLDLIERCVEIDDLFRAGHNAFFTEEYSLAQYHYYCAARLIRQVCKSLSKGLTLPPYSANEPELSEESVSGKTLPKLPPGAGWIGPSTRPDFLLEMTPDEARQAQTDFVTKLYYSYLPGNVPGVDLGRGQIPLHGVEARGSFTPLYEAYTGSTSGNSMFGEWVSHLKKQGWTPAFGTLIWVGGGGGAGPGTIYYGWNGDENGNLKVGRTAALSIQGALIYDLESSLSRLAAEVECVLGASCDCGVIFNWGERNGKTAAGYAGVNLSSGEARLGWLDENMKLTTAPPIRAVSLAQGDRVRIHVCAVDGAVRARFDVYRNKTWEPLASIPATESLPAVSLTPHLPAKGKIGLYVYQHGTAPSFYSMKVWDLSPATGVFADRAFFLQPGYPAEVKFKPPFSNPRPKYHLLLGGPNSTYKTRTSYQKSLLDTAYFVDYLPRAIAVDYDSRAYVVSGNVVDSGFDAFYQGEQSDLPTAGLWYGRGDERLLRDNLGEWLDLLPNLFIHQYFFMLPVCMGDAANALGQYQEALNWYRLVFDERPKDAKQRPVYRYLNAQIEGTFMAQRIARNYVDWADHLFRRNTLESTQEARLRYRRVLDLLDADDCCGLKQHKAFHDVTMKMLGGGLAKAVVLEWRKLADWLAAHPLAAKNALANVDAALEVAGGGNARLAAVQRALSALPDRGPKRLPRPRQLSARLDRLERAYPQVLDATEAASSPSAPEPSPVIALPPASGADVRASTEGAAGAAGVIETESSPAGLYSYSTAWSLVSIEPPPLLDDWVVNVVAASGASAFSPGTFSKGGPFKYYPDSKIDFTHEFCIPPNPYNRSLIERACLGIRHIDLCFNALGFPQGDVSIYRFDYLLHLAKNYANLALAAEKDFIQFKEKFESDTLELMNAGQAVSLLQAGARLADLSRAEALNGVAAAALQVAAVDVQIRQVEQRLAELRSDSSLRVLGTVFAAMAVGIGSAFSGGAVGAAAFVGIAGGVGKAAAGATDFLRGLDESEKSLRFQLERLRVFDASATALNLVNAEQHRRSAEQQALVARLESQFAAERAAFLGYQFFNPQLWSFLAGEVKKNYRAYLHYGVLTAWLAQRALEFELGVEPRRRFASSWPPDARDNSLNIIHFDYYQAAQQGLLAADSLLRDITALEQQKLLNDQRKLSITKVISISQRDPLAFVRFLETGQLHFGTSLLDFDLDYPGHYQRRIKEVRLNLYGLVGPEGIRATLSNPGPTRVVVKEWDDAHGRPVFVEKTLAYPQVSVALTNPQPGGIGRTTLVAGSATMLEPFEGMGVAGQWALEMLPAHNAVEFSSITDIQLVMDYTALADDQYRQEVLGRLPRDFSAIRPYSFCAEFSDACFHLMDVTRPMGMLTTNDGITGWHTLQLVTRAGDFPPNARDLALEEVVVYFRSRGDKTYANLQLYLSCGQRLAVEHLDFADLTLVQPAMPTRAAMVPATVNLAAFDSAPHYLGRWKAQDLDIPGQVKVADTWYLHVPPAQNAAFVKLDQGNQPVTVGGQPVLDFCGLRDVVFALFYTYRLDIPTS